MPDISMCTGQNFNLVCPKRKECYRFTAIPSPYRQSYFMQAPFETDQENNVVCCHFTDNS